MNRILMALSLLTAGLCLGACDQDGDSKDTASPPEDTLATDTAAQEDTPAALDTLPDAPPPPPDTIVDIPPPPEDSQEDLPPLPDSNSDCACLDGAGDLFADTLTDILPDLSSDIPPDIPEMPPYCCLSDADCEEIAQGGWTCAWGSLEAQNPAWGRCMGPLTWEDDLCWDDGDCAEDQECWGASYCPCDMGCGMADMPGQCQDPEELGDEGALCGQSGGDCKPELVCCYPCGIQGCQWQCAVPCDEGEEWCAGGCPMLP